MSTKRDKTSDNETLSQKPIEDMLGMLAGRLTMARADLEAISQQLREQGNSETSVFVAQAMTIAEVSRNMVMDAHDELLGKSVRTKAFKSDDSKIAQAATDYLLKRYKAPGGDKRSKEFRNKRGQARALAMIAWRAVESVREYAETKGANEYAYWMIFEIRGWTEKFSRFHRKAPLATPVMFAAILNRSPKEEQWNVARSKVALFLSNRPLPPSKSTIVDATRIAVEALGIDAKTANNWFSVDL